MITLQHPAAPTVKYTCPLPIALSSYAVDHLFAYDVYVVDDVNSVGVTLEVMSKNGDRHHGFVEVTAVDGIIRSAHARDSDASALLA